MIENWGFFHYDSTKKLVVRDEGTIIVKPTRIGTIVLESLLEQPDTQVDYQEICRRIGDPDIWRSIHLKEELEILRLQLGDVDLGTDPRNKRFHIWRYINSWDRSANRKLGLTPGNGLILQNWTSETYNQLIQSFL